MVEPIVALSLSGGKDSAAASLFLKEKGIPHFRLFFDTGWEHVDLYRHLDYLETVLGPIVRLTPRLPDLPASVLPEVLEIERIVGASPSGMVRWAVYKGMFPGRMRRWCTQLLKIHPFLAWAEAQDGDILNVVGIRADESRARANLPEREEMPGAANVEVWRPLLRWSETDVIAIHQRHGVAPCPLYLRGASRVGCWPCIQSNKAELARLDDRRVDAIERLEALVARQAAKRRPDRSPPAFFQSATPVRREDGAPTYPCIPIRKVLEWAKTERGGRQMRLGDWGEEAGCVRWGMCEVE